MAPGTDADAHAHDDLHNPDVAHESTDISIKGVVWFVIILAVTVAVVQVAMWGLMKVFDRNESANDPFVSPLAAPAGTLPPDPRLQTTPWEDLKHFRAGEDLALHSYGWIDRKGGVVRLPIDKAKALLLQRGIPVRANAPTDPTEGTHVASTGESNSAREIPAGQADMSSGSVAPQAGTTGPGTAAAQPSQTAQVKKPGGGT
ncbi:MAG TPA: hypothetical protein VL484_09955 [Vicinamibacterales bacterium]|jgi:hypothetical protein|nr:hypothetical protein [Vicinamibacterales bacterium]